MMRDIVERLNTPAHELNWQDVSSMRVDAAAEISRLRTINAILLRGIETIAIHRNEVGGKIARSTLIDVAVF